MYCSHLSVLKDFFTEDEIEKLNNYFSGLVGGAVNNITVSKVANSMEITSEEATRILTKCKDEGIVKIYYAIRCSECNVLIEKIDNLKELPKEEFICYACDEEINVTTHDVEVIFALIEPSFFSNGQHEEFYDDKSAKHVAQIDNLDSILRAGYINNIMFSPTEEEYIQLKEMYDSIFLSKKTTKAKGDTLESLIIYLFNLCSAFKAAGIRTSTNQIDCYVRNLYSNYGFLKDIGGSFFIECKNEKSTPKGDYMSKLHSIIKNTNGKINMIKLGIIISKKKPPKTFKGIATKTYLSDNIILISIYEKELKELIELRGNLLEMLERKIEETILDATTDLKNIGLFSS